MLGVHGDPFAMADRGRMLDSLLMTLAHPRVDGVLGSADVIEELALLGALDEQAGVRHDEPRWADGCELGARRPDDGVRPAVDRRVRPRRRQGAAAHRRRRRRHGAHPRGVRACGAASYARTGCRSWSSRSRTTTSRPAGRAARRRRRVAAGGRRRRRPRRHQRVHVVEGPGRQDPARMLACTTLPALILGGAPGPDPEATFESWEAAMDRTERAWTRRRAIVVVPARRRRRRRHRSRGAYRARPRRTRHDPASPPRHARRRRRSGRADARRRRVVVHRAARPFVGPGSRALHLDRRVRGLSCSRCRRPTSTVRCDGEHVPPRRPRLGVRPGHRLRLRAPRRDRDASSRAAGGEVAIATARCERRLAASLRLGRRCCGRDPRRRPGDSTGQQLHEPRGVAARRQVDVRRADHARRQLVELPAASPRRLAGVPGEQRGDLLLPDRRGRQQRVLGRWLRHASHVHARRLDRR